MTTSLVVAGVLFSAGIAAAQPPPADQTAQERAAAEAEVPRLAELLSVQRGATVADVGAGFGAMSIVMAKWLGPQGRVLATDVAARQLAEIRDYAKREGVNTITVIESAAASSNLPAGCCDAIFIRDVYHHLTATEPFNRTLRAALKPGGRLAIIDFQPDPGSKLSAGVNPNRGGHGIPRQLVIDELTAAGFVHERTIERWPEPQGQSFLVLFRTP